LGVCGFIFMKSQKTVEVDMSIVDIIVRNSTAANPENSGSGVIPGYYNNTIEVKDRFGNVKGFFTYCETSLWFFRKCHTSLNGYTAVN